MMISLKKPAVYAFLILCITAIGCKQKTTADTGLITAADTAIKQSPEAKAADNQKLLGSYSGSFGDNKITILLTAITPDSIVGRSVVAGNDRPFKGTMIEQNAAFAFAAKEPGDEKHDGVFSFIINKNDLDKVQGSWKPYDSMVTKAKQFNLSRKEFKYVPSVGEYSIASTRLLKQSDVENLDHYELFDMRNTIFARHGYCFSRRASRDYFESMDWYIPYSANVMNDLTDIERKNISLIKKYEKYASEYGDDFGR